MQCSRLGYCSVSAPRLPKQRRALVTVRAQAVDEVVTATVQEVPGQSGTEDIYIGFPKGDYAPRQGRQGRVVKDDPKKYPNKEDLGPFTGVVGGWAGGEAGLWKIREAYQNEAESKSKPVNAAPPAAPVPEPSSPKEELIYVGFGKNELELRKSGAKGRVVVDDPRKYPNKEDIGFFAGATGGFAGGEYGLRRFIEEGEIKLRPEGQPARSSQFSPLTLAGLLVVAGAGGGIALDRATSVGSDVVTQGKLALQPVDENTRTLLIMAVLLLSVVGLIGGSRALANALQERMREGVQDAQKLLIYAGFVLGLYFAARAVLEL